MKAILPLAVSLLVTNMALAQGSAFTYQGRLDTPQGPANGLYDFRCQLYDTEQFGALVSTTVTNSAVRVTNGLFVLNLDFGAAVFNGQSRWLLITMRTNNDLNFSALVPRQRLSPAPYAMYAGVAGTLSSGASVTFNPASGPPFNVTSATKVPNLNADWLDGLDSGAFVLKAGDTMSGSLNIANPSTLNFGNSTRQMLNLWGSTYGIGVQSGTLYFRADGNFANSGHFAWYRGGAHDDGLLSPGDDGEALMTLRNSGNLAVTATSGTAVNGNAIATIGGIGVQGLAGGPANLGPLGFFPAWGVRGSAQGTNSGGVFGEALAQTTETWGVLGRAHSSAGYGVAGENDSAFGIAVYGLQGTGNGGTVSRAGVYGESTESNGNGVVGQANAGSSAFGVWGRSTEGDGGHFSGGRYGVYGSSGAGFAGQFDGAVRVQGNSSHGKPFLQLHETEDGDYARIQLQVANRPLWHVSVGGGDNSLVFYNSANSIVTSVSETGILTTKVLTITGGADIAEPFEMSHDEITKGSVVVIDEQNPGKLKLSARAYDTRVAGVVSGAGGVQPGLTLQQEHKLDGGQQVALTGRVYVQADASREPIQPGDLLTTSDTPGHAMKVSDHSRAQGAILGKAMTALNEGKGLVLVLVTLQ
jgi:hypothetical protein